MKNSILDTYLQPYAEEDELLNNWIENLISRVKLDLFKNQEEWLYMSDELEDGSFPKFKENARDYMWDVIQNNFSWLANYIVERLIAEYRLSNIDLDEDTILELKDDLGEDDYNKWEEEARSRILKEYSQYLGEEKAKEVLYSKWGRK